MKFLHRSGKGATTSGHPLPQPFTTFNKYGIQFRRGEITMIAAEPGAGKSTLALAIAIRMQVPTLYFSIDSPDEVQRIRALAMITGFNQDVVEAKLSDDPEGAARVFKHHASHIAWDYKTETMWDFEETLNVYELVMGSPPQLVVVDNATDIDHESGDEYQSLRALFRLIKGWAKATDAHILVLHHTSESYEGRPCPPRAAVHGKVNQKPAVILTIGTAQDGFLPVAPVKNRNGFQDKTGSTAVWLRYAPESMTLRDPS